MGQNVFTHVVFFLRRLHKYKSDVFSNVFTKDKDDHDKDLLDLLSDDKLVWYDQKRGKYELVRIPYRLRESKLVSLVPRRNE
jgi:hypothetical protein